MILVQVDPVLINLDRIGPALDIEIGTLELVLDAGWCSATIVPKALLKCFKIRPSSSSTKAKNYSQPSCRASVKPDS